MMAETDPHRPVNLTPSLRQLPKWERSFRAFIEGNVIGHNRRSDARGETASIRSTRLLVSEYKCASLSCTPATVYSSPLDRAGEGGDEIGRAHVWTPDTNAHIECR